jgi:P-type E1-E2 ATPase
MLAIFPHEVCPVDGEVIDGHGEMDESYLTGEPYEIAKAPGSQVLSGAINQDTVLKIRATRLPVDSRYARILKVVEEAEQDRPKIRRIADRLGAWYTPIALLVGALGWIVSGSAERFLAVIVIATPCPLLIGIPVAIIGGFRWLQNAA